MCERQIKLEVRKRLDQDATVVLDSKAGGLQVRHQNVQRVRPAVAVLALGQRHCRVVVDAPHTNGNLPRQGVRIGYGDE